MSIPITVHVHEHDTAAEVTVLPKLDNGKVVLRIDQRHLPPIHVELSPEDGLRLGSELVALLEGAAVRPPRTRKPPEPPPPAVGKNWREIRARAARQKHGAESAQRTGKRAGKPT